MNSSRKLLGLVSATFVIAACSSTSEPADDRLGTSEQAFCTPYPSCCPRPYGGKTAWSRADAFEVKMASFNCRFDATYAARAHSTVAQNWYLVTRCPNTSALRAYVASKSSVSPDYSTFESCIVYNTGLTCSTLCTTSSTAIVKFDPNCSGCGYNPPD